MSQISALLGAIAIAIPALAMGHPKQEGVEPATLEEAIGLARSWFIRSYDEADKSESLDACAAVLEPWIEDARRNFRNFDDPFPWLYSACKFGFRSGDKPPNTEQEVHAWLTPWLDLLLAKSSDRLLPIKWRVGYHFQMSDQGYRAIEAPMFEAEIQHRLDQLLVTPNDLLVKEELAYVVRCYFGMWKSQSEVRRLHAMFTVALGEGHQLTLSLLRSIAYHERSLGRPKTALESIERAVSLTRSQHPDDLILNAHMATEYAACLSQVGRLAEAADQLKAAREVFVSLTPIPHGSLTRIDYNLAEIALEMSDLDGTVQYANSSIEHAKLSGDPGMLLEARVPRATRDVARLQLGIPEAAHDLRAVLAETEMHERHVGGQAFALVEYAVALGDRDLIKWSTDFADGLIRRYSGPMAANSALRPLMSAWQATDGTLLDDGVRPALEKSLAISLTGRSMGTLALTQFKLAQNRAADDPETAIWLYKRAANSLQQLRYGLPSAEPELHRTWLGAHESDLRNFVSLLIDSGRLVEAEQALAALRDEEAHEYSRRSRMSAIPAAAPLQSLSFTPAEEIRNRALQQVAIEAEASALAADRRMDQRKGRTGLWSDYIDPEANADIAFLSEEVHRVVSEAPSSSRSIQFISLAPEALPAHTARLSYLVRDQSLSIVLQLEKLHLQKTVQVSRPELNRAIESARAALSAPNREALPALQSLYRWLVAPFAAELRRAGVSSLVWVPDGALRYVPFAALHDGKRFLVQKFVMQTRWASHLTASASRGAMVSNAHRRHRFTVAFGRSRGDELHSALPGVLLELSATRQAGGRTWSDEQFTEQALRKALVARPSTVHLASHFELDPGGEEKSYLLLGDGQKMSLATLASLPWQGVQLALLSACDSGISFDWGAGQAQVGFAVSLHRAGVENVLATLWRVSDGGSAEWMRMLYSGKAAEHAPHRTIPGPIRFTPARLAATQRLWLRRHQGQPLSHPHYWAAYVWLTP